MSDLFLLTDTQMARLKPCFPKVHGERFSILRLRLIPA